MDVFEFDTVEDAENYIALVTDIDRYYDQICDYEEARVDYGYASSDTAYEDIAVSFDNLAAMEDNCFLYDTFASRLDNIEGITDDQKAALIEQHDSAMHDSFFPEFVECASRMRALIGSGGSDTGLYYLEGGEAYCDYIYRALSNSTMTIEEMTTQLDETITNSYNTEMEIIAAAYDDPNSTLIADYMAADFSQGDMSANLTFLEGAIATDFPGIPPHAYHTFDVPEELQENFDKVYNAGVLVANQQCA